jgi:hypothetical protein
MLPNVQADEGAATMTLPVTFDEAIEAQAVAEARAIIRSVRDEKFTPAPGLTLSRFDKADSRRLVREFLKSLAAANVHRLRGVIDCAEAGWTVALHELAEEYEARDEKAPSRLRLYILDAADIKRSRRRGRPPGGGDLSLRDMTIICIVAVISQRFNLRATRNPASKSRSACRVVTLGLEAERLGLSDSSLETLWSHWGPTAYHLIFDTPYPFSR